PKNAAIPGHLQRRAASVWRATDMALIGDLPVIEQRAAIGQIPGLTGWVGHLPSVDDVSLHIDQVDCLIVARQWAEQGEPGKGTVRVVSTEAHATPLYRDGFNARHGWRRIEPVTVKRREIGRAHV